MWKTTIVKYWKVIIFFFIFLIVLTLSESIKIIKSHIHKTAITKEVSRALNAYMKDHCTQTTKIKNVWIRKVDFLSIGGPYFDFEFEYYKGQWNKYSNSAGEGDFIYITIYDKDFCSGNRETLAYDHQKKEFVVEEKNKDYRFKDASILGGFARGAGIIYCLIVLFVDLAIALIWIAVIRKKSQA